MPPPHDDDRPHPLLRLLIALAAVALCLAGLRRLAERRMAERFHYHAARGLSWIRRTGAGAWNRRTHFGVVSHVMACQSACLSQRTMCGLAARRHIAYNPP